MTLIQITEPSRCPDHGNSIALYKQCSVYSTHLLLDDVNYLIIFDTTQMIKNTWYNGLFRE